VPGVSFPSPSASISSPAQAIIAALSVQSLGGGIRTVKPSRAASLFNAAPIA
jgi:hypothetical protein